MKLKQIFLAAALAAVSAVSVAAETDKALPALDTFTSTDVASLFEQDAQPLQLAALSAQEMQDTQGAWFPIYFPNPFSPVGLSFAWGTLKYNWSFSWL